MLNCGIDFGSTYSVISVYREDTRVVEAVILDQKSPYIPTVVSMDEKGGELDFGLLAKNQTGKKDYQVFKEFKMLISERENAIVQKRGFSEKFPPQKIAGEFLKNLTEKIMAYAHQNEIGRLVIGAPEIWFRSPGRSDSYHVLKDICKEIPGIKNVEVVSEPSAACAFFAYNYQLNKHQPFHGYVLLIDYGGGTLDNSLAYVTADEADESGKNMEIQVIHSNGAGDVTENKIGNAGIVYMESLLEKAIQDAGFLEKGDKPEKNSKFYRTLNELEEMIKSSTEKIANAFKDIGIENLDELQEEKFTSVDYQGRDIEINYGQMAEVYNREIRSVLSEKIDEMISFMDEQGIIWNDKERGDFKIAIAGGFGNFYLVKQQVSERFGLLDKEYDRRQQDIMVKTDCENAISYGTALLAADMVRIRRPAPCSIGIRLNWNGEEMCCFPFHYREILEPNQVYIPVSNTDGREIVTYLPENSVPEFIVSTDCEEKEVYSLVLPEKIREKLKKLPSKLVVMGFSVDEAEMLYLHVFPYDVLSDSVDRSAGMIVELEKMKELFKYSGKKKSGAGL